MAFLEVHMVQVKEILRRWQAGESKMAIGRASGVSARTVGRYIEAASALGLKRDGEPPAEEVLAQLLRRNHPGPLPARQTPAAASLVGKEEQLARWLKEERLQLTRVHELLVRDGISVSYTSLRRYVREAGLWKPVQATVRMAPWPAGEVAEMDFGKLGSIVDPTTGKRQTVWALLVILPYSRHCFAERLDAACKRALAYDLIDVRRVHRILLQAIGPETPAEEGAAAPLGSRFARPGSAFDHHQPASQEATA